MLVNYIYEIIVVNSFDLHDINMFFVLQFDHTHVFTVVLIVSLVKKVIFEVIELIGVVYVK